ncbi:MAG: hypothetical protein RRZ65_04580 [Tannerellaceae bacterium]
MKTKEENRGKEKGLPKKKRLLSDEELLGVAAGGGPGVNYCVDRCRSEGTDEEQCVQICKKMKQWD